MRKAVFIHLDGIPEGKNFEDLTDEQLIEMYEEDDLFMWVYESLDSLVSSFNTLDAPNPYTCVARMVDFPDKLEQSRPTVIGQKALAKMLGVAQSQISRWMHVGKFEGCYHMEKNRAVYDVEETLKRVHKMNNNSSLKDFLRPLIMEIIEEITISGKKNNVL